MGFKGMNIGSIMLIVSLAVLLFGTRRLRDAGGDIAKMIKDFRHGMTDEKEPNP